MLHFKSYGRKAAIAGLALAFCPAPSILPSLIVRADGQRLPGRVRRPPAIPPGAILVPTPPPHPASPEPSPQAPANTAQTLAAPVPPSSPAAPLPPSLLEKPAQAAQIEFGSGTLSIRADNSSLGAILNTLSAKSGMHIAGLNSDERVFGNFGPGTPRAVLSDLLNGTPYNIVMVGDLSNGAPRQLILSPASPESASSPQPQPLQTSETDQEQGQNNSPPPAAPRPGYYPPGANPGLPNPGAQQPGAPSQVVKTPQQLFRELQELRQQRLQQQEQQQQN